MAHVVKVDDRTFAAVPQIVSGKTTIDGYIFVGMPYYYDLASQVASPTDPSKWVPAPINAVDTWLKLLADPNYASLPPVTSISVEAEVGGTVEPEPVKQERKPGGRRGDILL